MKKHNKFTFKAAETSLMASNKLLSRVKIFQAGHINESTFQISVEFDINNDKFYDLYYLFDLKTIGNSLSNSINNSIKYYQNLDEEFLLSSTFLYKQYFHFYAIHSGIKLDVLPNLIIKSLKHIDRDKYKTNALRINKLRDTMLQNHYLPNGIIDPLAPKAVYKKPTNHLRFFQDSQIDIS